MVSGDMEFSWKNFCTVVFGTLMLGCDNFPCPSRTVALTRTGLALRCPGNVDSWRHTLFTMVPKSGTLHQTRNWRPIAPVKIAYMIPALQRERNSRLTPPRSLLWVHQENSEDAPANTQEQRPSTHANPRGEHTQNFSGSDVADPWFPPSTQVAHTEARAVRASSAKLSRFPSSHAGQPSWHCGPACIRG